MQGGIGVQGRAAAERRLRVSDGGQEGPGKPGEGQTIGGRGAGGWSLSDTWIPQGWGACALRGVWGQHAGQYRGESRRDGPLGLEATHGHPIQ